MTLAQVTQSGNVSLPKLWRDELGIAPNTKVLLIKKSGKIIIEPLHRKNLGDAFKEIDEEIKKKKVKFTMDEAVADDLYD